jgi:two-component system, cell cycle sensor histidine kinase and response regulator CckA
VPDLVLTDVVLPGMSGLEVVERIRSLLPRARVAYLSGYTHEAMGHHGVLGATTEFIEKPFSADTLLRKVRAALDAGG